MIISFAYFLQYQTSFVCFWKSVYERHVWFEGFTLMTMSNALDDIYTITTSQPDNGEYASELMNITHSNMSLTLCWWFNRMSDSTPSDTFFSISSAGNCNQILGYIWSGI